MKNTQDQHDIRLVRQRYNAAIKQRDADAICACYTQDYHVITGRGVQSHGIDAQHERWCAAFAADPVMLYRRKTRELRVSTPVAVAEEVGNWSGKYSLDKKIVLVAGVYAASWQKQESGAWLIQTEVFTTLRSKVHAV
jgi:ketosteroid isomerase-like protein